VKLLKKTQCLQYLNLYELNGNNWEYQLYKTLIHLEFSIWTFLITDL
jgi:hypothetical protein